MDRGVCRIYLHLLTFIHFGLVRDDEKFVLVFDEASKLVDEKEPGIPLFNSDGTESDLFKKYIDRLVQIRSSHRVVEEVSALLDEFNLLFLFH